MNKQTKMTDRNPHTGAKLQTQVANDKYRDNWDAIFGKPKSKSCELCGDFIDDWDACKVRNCPNKAVKDAD
jgi:hypothetical protein